jgi:rsbT antagonist protein RsbS
VTEPEADHADEAWVVHQGGSAPSPIPIIALWGRLLVPLQGDVGDTQLQELEERLLSRIAQRGANGLVIDVSGVVVMDSHLCATLSRMAAAARMMGVPSVMCGIAPAMALTLEAMDLRMEWVETSLGLESALGRLGVQVVRGSDSEEEVEQ